MFTKIISEVIILIEVIKSLDKDLSQILSNQIFDQLLIYFEINAH